MVFGIKATIDACKGGRGKTNASTYEGRRLRNHLLFEKEQLSAKITEKIMYDRLNNYLVQNNCLHPLQHGFQSGHSTEISLMNLQDKITEAKFDKNKFSLGIFIDLAKAFDTVDHTILIEMLQKYGIR